VAWRRRAAAARGVAPGGPLADPPVAVRRIRVLDALRYRPLAGARFVPEAPAGPALATTDTDGWAELPHRSDHLVAQAPGYVPEPVAAPPADGEPAERLALLRGRDALAILLEAPGGPEGRPAGTWPESILRLAGRVLPSADAQRVARLCYRRPGTLEPADRPVVEALVRRAVAAPAEAPVPYPALPGLLDALSSEPPGGAGRAGSAPAAGPPGALQG
jgi:hypothetical protein